MGGEMEGRCVVKGVQTDDNVKEFFFNVRGYFR